MHGPQVLLLRIISPTLIRAVGDLDHKCNEFYPAIRFWIRTPGNRTRPCVIFIPWEKGRILQFISRMPYLPQLSARLALRRRAGPRVRFPETTPAVLRLADGNRVPGKLQLISISGGLLGLSRPLKTHSVIKLMFVAPTGSVFAAAKMLNPLSWGLQPFRFVTLGDHDRSKLQTAIQSSLAQSARQDKQRRRGHDLIEKYRPW